MKQSEKIKLACVELIRLITSKGCSVKFLPPPGGLLGEFEAMDLEIRIYKERSESLKPEHIFTLAHEYRHLCQYLILDEIDEWLFCIDAINKPNLKASEKQEQEADKFAIEFCRSRKIRVPKTIKDKILNQECTLYE